jgi:hypothetical protein
MRARALDDLAKAGIVVATSSSRGTRSSSTPRTCTSRKASLADVAEKKRVLASRGVHSIGRYGAWTYCSIEDNIVEARALADDFNVVRRLTSSPG